MDKEFNNEPHLHYFLGKFLCEVQLVHRKDLINISFILPKEFTKKLFKESNGEMWVTIFGGSINCYPSKEFIKTEKRILDYGKNLEKLNEGNKSFEMFKMFFLGNAIPMKITQKGKFKIKNSFAEYAGIKDSYFVCVVGNLNYFEVWKESKFDENFDQYLERLEEKINTTTELEINKKHLTQLYNRKIYV